MLGGKDLLDSTYYICGFHVMFDTSGELSTCHFCYVQGLLTQLVLYL